MRFCLLWVSLFTGVGTIFCKIIGSEEYLCSRRDLVVIEKQTSDAMIDLREDLEGVLSQRKTAGKHTDFEVATADLLTEQARVLCKMITEFGKTLPLLSKAIQVIPDKNKEIWGFILILFWEFGHFFGGSPFTEVLSKWGTPLWAPYGSNADLDKNTHLFCFYEE